MESLIGEKQIKVSTIRIEKEWGEVGEARQRGGKGGRIVIFQIKEETLKMRR